MLLNLCYRCNDPSHKINESAVKPYLVDTGLLISLTFSENELYRAILNGKTSVNGGMLYESVIAQMPAAKDFF